MTATCKLTARWSVRLSGEPRPGVLFGAPRGRTIYEIVSARRIERRRRGGYNFLLTCVRHARGDIPPEATVLHWAWDKRARRGR